MKMSCFTPKKEPLIRQIHLENQCNILWSTRQEQPNNWASPQVLMHRFENYNRLATFQFNHISCPMFLTTCMERIPQNLDSMQKLNWTIDVSMKDIIYLNITKCFTSIKKNNTIDIQAKFASECQAFDGSQHPHMSSQHNKNMTTSHLNVSFFFAHSNHLQIARVRCLWVDIHTLAWCS